MSTKPKSHLYQGLASPAEAIMPASPSKVASSWILGVLFIA
jgi:hypothetical protein